MFTQHYVERPDPNNPGRTQQFLLNPKTGAFMPVKGSENSEQLEQVKIAAEERKAKLQIQGEQQKLKLKQIEIRQKYIADRAKAATVAMGENALGQPLGVVDYRPIVAEANQLFPDLPFDDGGGSWNREGAMDPAAETLWQNAEGGAPAAAGWSRTTPQPDTGDTEPAQLFLKTNPVARNLVQQMQAIVQKHGNDPNSWPPNVLNQYQQFNAAYKASR